MQIICIKLLRHNRNNKNFLIFAQNQVMTRREIIKQGGLDLTVLALPFLDIIFKNQSYDRP